MPEYLSKRFGGTRLQIYLTIVCLATYLFGNLSVSKSKIQLIIALRNVLYG